MRKLLLFAFSTMLIFAFSVNVSAQQGKIVKVSNDQELLDAKADLSIDGVTLEEGYYSTYNEYFNEGTTISFATGNNGSRACDYFIQPNSWCWDEGLMPNVGTAVAGVTPGPPTCATEDGFWQGTDPMGDPVVFASPNSYVSDFNAPYPGEYELKFTWNLSSGAPPGTNVQTSYFFYTTPDVLIFEGPDVCGLESTLSVSIDDGSYGYPILTTTYYYSYNGGMYAPWTPNFTGNPYSGTATAPVTVSDCGYVDLQVMIAGGPCQPVVETTRINFYDTPVVTANEDGDDEICGLEYTLIPSYTMGCDDLPGPVTTTWSLEYSSTGGTADFTTGDVVTVSQCGSYTFRYTVENAQCSAYDEVTIDFYDEPVVDAGPTDDVCMDALPYTLDPSVSVSCFSGAAVTTEWTKVSGPGTVVFSGDQVDVTECGTYVFRYGAWREPCDWVYDDVTVNFWDNPVVTIDPVPADICGYETTADVTVSVGGNCDDLAPITADDWAGYFNGSETADPDVTFTDLGDGEWGITVPNCGLWEFEVTAWNADLCEGSGSFSTTFHEPPSPAITGSAEVFACATDTYTAEDNRSCTLSDELDWTWRLIPPTAGTITDNGNGTADIEWDPSAIGTTVEVGLVVCIKQDDPGDGPNEEPMFECCADEIFKEVLVKIPTLAGQVKYWNEFETYMPTPFPTSINGTYPADYFYIELWENTMDMEYPIYAWDVPVRALLGDGDLVEPHIEVGNELQSYWEFELPVDVLDYGCETDFFVKIWDGGLFYDPNYPLNGFNEYLGAAYTYNNWGGVNATDASALLLMSTNTDINGAPYNYYWVGPNPGAPVLPTPYGYYSDGIADVNNTGTITALDPLTANYRSVGLIQKYPEPMSSNLFAKNFEVTGRMVSMLPEMTWDDYFTTLNVDDVPFAHSDEDYQYYDQAADHKYSSVSIPWEATNNYMNIYYEAIGDINASYVPTSDGFKTYEGNELVYEGRIGAGTDDVLTVPVRIDQEANVSAISLNMTYRNDLIEVLGVNYGEDYYKIDQEAGTLRIGWFGEEAKEFNAEDVIAQIEVRVLGDISADTKLFKLDANTELADPTAAPIDGVTFKSMSLTTDLSELMGSELQANNYPNPFKDNTMIEFVLPEAGKVQLKVYNEMGQLVGTFVDATLDAGVQTYELNNSNLKAGVYFYQITLDGAMDYAVTKSMIVVE